MSKETFRESSTHSGVGELKARLHEAEYLANRFRYSQALQVLEQLLKQHDDLDTAEEVLSVAKTLKANIDAKRRGLHARLIIVSLFILSVLSVGILQFVRVASTEIIADLETNGVYLELLHDSAIESNPVESIILYDIEELSAFARALDQSNRETSERRPATLQQEDIILNPNKPLTIRTGGGSGTLRVSGEHLELQRLELYRDVPVYLESAGGPKPTMTIRQLTNKAFGRIDTGSDVFIECPNCELHHNGKKPVKIGGRFHLSLSSHELEFSGQKKPADVALVIRPTDEMDQKNAISQVLPLHRVDFTRSDLGNPVSLIRGGVIKFTELDDRKLSLSENDFLIAEGLTDFEIIHLTLSNPIHLRLQGKVCSLKSGSGTALFSRMPTLLEWILKNKPLGLFVATASTVFSFLLAAFLKLHLIPKD